MNRFYNFTSIHKTHKNRKISWLQNQIHLRQLIQNFYISNELGVEIYPEILSYRK